MKNHAMLRILGIVSVCMMLILFTASAAADAIDLAAMTDTEVITLLDKVNQEIVDRGIQKTAKMARGSYIAGKDLPAGSYIYTCLAVGDDWGNLTVYSDGGSGKQLLWNIVQAPKEGEERETIFITLNEGDRLKSDVAFSLTIYSGVIFR